MKFNDVQTRTILMAGVLFLLLSLFVIEAVATQGKWPTWPTPAGSPEPAAAFINEVTAPAAAKASANQAGVATFDDDLDSSAVRQSTPHSMTDFTDIGAGLTGVDSSSVTWGDYDNDGDPDILLTGWDSSNTPVAKVYRNDNGTFNDIEASLMGVYQSSVAWGDYDNDGNLDILLTGYNGSTGVAKVYQNDNGSFSDIPTNLTGVYNSSVAWGDYDNDSDLDILLTGRDNNHTPVAKVYRNDNGTFNEIEASLTGVSRSSVAWGDYDNDNDLDILLTGRTGSTDVTKIYQNENGSFSDIGANLTGVSHSSVAWGDYDNDNDLDILLTGQVSGTTAMAKVYQNENGSFSDIGANLTGVYLSSVAWGDYDNDGDLDILLTGWTGSTAVAKVYQNDNGTFSDIGANLTGVGLSSVAWGDYDNDNDLDILLTGSTGSTRVAKVYKANTENTPPVITEINITPTQPSTEDSLSLSYTYFDADGDLERDTLIHWYRNSQHVPAYDDGLTVIPSAETRLEDVWHVVVTPHDGHEYGNPSASDPVTISGICNTPPEIHNLTINEAVADGKTGWWLVPSAGTALTASYTYHDHCGNDEGDTQIRWRRKYKLEEGEEPGLNDKKHVQDRITIAEEYWCVTVTPHNGIKYGAPKESCAYIERVANQLPEVEVTMAEFPSVNDPLTITLEITDADGDDNRNPKGNDTQVRWYRDNVLQPKFSDLREVEPNETNIGEVWCAMGRAHDGIEYGAISERICQIINPPEGRLPFITNAHIRPSEAKDDDDLELKYEYNDPDTLARGAENVEIQWFREGTLQPELNNNKTVPSGFTIPGEKWSAKIRPILLNSFLPDGRWIETDPVYISSNNVNSPPEATNLIINPRQPSINDDLRLGYKFTDADGDSEGDTIIWWYTNLERVERYDGIRKIPAQELDDGEVWHAVVIPYDGQDYGKRVHAHSVKIGTNTTPGKPKVRDVYLSPKRPGENDNLELRYSYHHNDPYSIENAEIKWFVNGVYTSSYDNRTIIDGQKTRITQTWHAQITPTVSITIDETILGDSVETNRVQITTVGTNTLPTVSDVHLLPLVPRSSDDLVLNYQYFDPDGDLEADTQIYWLRKSDPFNRFENLTVIPSEETSPGDEWIVQIKAGDGSGQRSEPVTNTVTINTPPTVTNGVITPSLSYLDQSLTLIYEYDDEDNHPPGDSSIKWYKNGSHQDHLDHEETVPSTELSADQTWYAVMSTHDGYEYSDPYTTTEVTISYLFLPLILRPVPTITPTPTPIPTATPTPGPYEHNDTDETAHGPLELGRCYEAYPEDDDDWYSVRIIGESTVKVRLENFKLGYDGQLLVYKEYLDEHIPNQPRPTPIHHDGGGSPTREKTLTNLHGIYLIRVYTPGSEDQVHKYCLTVTKE